MPLMKSIRQGTPQSLQASIKNRLLYEFTLFDKVRNGCTSLLILVASVDYLLDLVSEIRFALSVGGGAVNFLISVNGYLSLVICH